MTARVLVGHVLDRLADLEDESVQMCLTSPPYLNLRDYGLPSSVWGGLAECDHQWGEAIRALWANDVPGPNSGGKNAAFRITSKTAGQFCACGAWFGCLGQEPTVEMFIEHLVLIFRAVWRVLRKDGVLLVNLGDSYAGSGKGPTGHNGIGDQERRQGFTGYGKKHEAGRAIDAIPTVLGRRDGRGIRSGKVYELRDMLVMPGRKPKDLMLVPEMFLLAMQADGWYPRSKIAWVKTSAMPESVDDRPTSAWEPIFLFAKSRKYFWDREATRTALAASTTNRRWLNGGNGKDGALDPSGKVASGAWAISAPTRIPNEDGAAMRNVWLLGPEPSRYEYCGGCDSFYLGPERNDTRVEVWDVQRAKPGWKKVGSVCPGCGEADRWVAHFAAFPTELARRALLGGTSEKGACAGCGSPWARVLERTAMVVREGPGRSGLQAASLSATSRTAITGTMLAPATSRTVGWQPTCRCKGVGETVPCVAMDIFWGSGTLSVAAKHIGYPLDSVGIELRDQYARLGQHRVERDVPKWARPVVVRRSRPAPTPVPIQPMLLGVGAG